MKRIELTTLSGEERKWNTKSYHKGLSKSSTSANTSCKMNGNGRMSVDNIFRILSNVGIMPKMSFLETKHKLF